MKPSPTSRGVSGATACWGPLSAALWPRGWPTFPGVSPGAWGFRGARVASRPWAARGAQQRLGSGTWRPGAQGQGPEVGVMGAEWAWGGPLSPDVAAAAPGRAQSDGSRGLTGCCCRWAVGKACRGDNQGGPSGLPHPVLSPRCPQGWPCPLMPPPHNAKGRGWPGPRSPLPLRTPAAQLARLPPARAP